MKWLSVRTVGKEGAIEALTERDRIWMWTKRLLVCWWCCTIQTAKSKKQRGQLLSFTSPLYPKNVAILFHCRMIIHAFDISSTLPSISKKAFWFLKISYYPTWFSYKGSSTNSLGIGFPYRREVNFKKSFLIRCTRPHFTFTEWLIQFKIPFSTITSLNLLLQRYVLAHLEELSSQPNWLVNY